MVIFRIFSREGLSALAYHPVTLFSVYFGLIHFLVPLVKNSSEYYRYQNSYSDITFIATALISLTCYLAAFIISSKFNSKNKLQLDSTEQTYSKISTLSKISLLTFSAGAIAAYLDYKTLSENIGLDIFLADRHSASDDRGATRLLANLMIIGFSLYIASITTHDKKKIHQITLAMIMLIYAFWYYSIITSRNSMLLFILFGMIVYAANQRKAKGSKQSTKKGSWLLLTLATLLITSIAYSLTVQRYSSSDSTYTQERLENVSLYMLDGAFGNDEALLWMIENEYPLMLGKTYLAAATNIVPRGLWPQKPLGGGPELINMISPGSYTIGAEGNNSLTTGLMTESMMNFGLLGIPLMILTWAYTSSRLVTRAIRSRRLATKTLYLIIAASLSSAFLYSEFLGFIFRIGMYAAPILIILLLKPSAGKIITHASYAE